jgi:hypothetical protein
VRSEAAELEPVVRGPQHCERGEPVSPSRQPASR